MTIHELANALGYCCPLTMMEALVKSDPQLIWETLGIPPQTFRRWKREYRGRGLSCKDRLHCSRRREQAPNSL